MASKNRINRSGITTSHANTDHVALWFPLAATSLGRNLVPPMWRLIRLTTRCGTYGDYLQDFGRLQLFSQQALDDKIYIC